MFVAGIRSAIQQQQPAGANAFWESKTDQLGTNFFFVRLTDEQANTIRNNALVKHVYVPTGPLILSFTPLFPGPFPVSSFMETDTNGHGTKCLSKAVGKTVGVARKARVVATVIDLRQSIYEHFLDALVLIHEDIYVKGRGTKSVVNFSISIVADRIPAPYQDTMAALIRAIIGLGAVVVTGSGNMAGSPYGYPALFGNPADRNYIPDLIVVGSVSGEGFRGVRHSDADWLTCYALGYTVDVAISGTGYKYKSTMGTSFYFLDPRNPDSVQNPSGPYYNDWEGVITRSSSTTSTPPASSSTTKPAPTGPIPTPGHGKAAPSWAMVYYMLRDKNGETHGFYGYDDSNFIPCTVEPATWRKLGGQVGAVPSTLTGITVYGDTSCRFASSDMMLRCNNWAPATCVNRVSGENYGGAGTCKVDYGAGIYQYWNNIILCSW
ncbi:hypothetical protein NEMBOFW57_004083 [Staphylotrichum longicolle]|uniref:Peptidase S8/S53 domain-containing protein n=1 Tax=Staphylotrichum longicolle TaxID=669026 RepID=A0AAD4F8Z1_9PEZI|nr:hypothetical protein NEMBOFW57_004083 [Staphylotrichum longicolle]